MDQTSSETAALSHPPAMAELQADLALARRCVAGEVAAWEELHSRYHEPLLTSIRMMSGELRDENIVHEVAARVWYSLVDKDGKRLSKYDPQRNARLITFLRALARDELCQYFRAEARRRRREQRAARKQGSRQDGSLEPVRESLAEFFGTLTSAETDFCQRYLLAQDECAVQSSYSATNVWQLTHRVYRKMLKFLGRK